jgi:ABC-2 type transport system permease protein
MEQAGALAGAIRYEFAMQLRRPALWVAFGLLGALVLWIGMQLATQPLGSRTFTHHDGLIEWTNACNTLLTLGAGLLIADRLRRDRSTRMGEMLQTLPAPAWTRLLGKYLGSVVATLVPIALLHFGGVAYLAIRWGDAGVVPLSVVAFLSLVVPPVFFVGAFALACTTVLWTPLFQFLFVGYFLWNGLNPAEPIPTLNNTLLSPTENYVNTGFFHMASPYQADAMRYPASSLALGLANIAVLLAAGAVALTAASWLQRWQVSRQ